jgi:hypothetical protein
MGIKDARWNFNQNPFVDGEVSWKQADVQNEASLNDVRKKLYLSEESFINRQNIVCTS